MKYAEFFLRSMKMALALFFGFIGAYIFILLDLPLPWILGAITASAIISRFDSLPIIRPKPLTGPARTVLGVTIGSAFTPAVIGGMYTYFWSLVFIVPFVIITAFLGVYYYWKIVGYDKKTAYFSAMPGGLMEMVSIAEDMKADLPKVTLAQSTRMAYIVFTLPFLIEYISHISLDGRQRITAPIGDIALWEMAVMIIVAFIGVKGAKRLKISGAYIVGPMILAAVVYAFGLIESRPPDEALKATQLVLGTTVGLVFHGIRLKEVLVTFVQTFGYFLIIIFVSASFIGLVYWLFDFQLLSLILAYSPGGQAEMNLIAIIIAANIPFVALHHLLRLFLVLSIAPIFAKWFAKEHVTKSE